MARLLASKGYSDVRPLLGGFDAWVEHGYPVEPHAGEAAVPVIVPAAAESAQG
jgi:3-mercaptopyruvate sulfurtransferase SseA